MRIFQSSYSRFRPLFAEDGRLDLDAAVSHFQKLVKNCFDHEYALTTGGHNIAMDIIPNDIATSCLTLGANLLDEETAKLSKLFERLQELGARDGARLPKSAMGRWAELQDKGDIIEISEEQIAIYDVDGICAI